MKRIFVLQAIISTLTMFLATACGIETFEPIISLRPPLGVTLENLTNEQKILIKFWGYNNETYFTGFTIYVSVNASDFDAGTAYAIPQPGETNLPTMPNLIPATAPTHYSFTNAYYTNGTALVPGQDYFFCVKAYSGVYYKYSDRSEITNITFQTN